MRELEGAKLGQQKTMTEYMSGETVDGKTMSARSRMNQESGNLDFESEGIIRLLKIRNPWGRKEWVGAFAKGDAIWTRKLKAELEQVDRDNGVFWITFHDFLRRYVRVDVCKAASQGWIGVSKSGSTNPMQLQTLEEFSIEIHESCQIYLWLIQKTLRRTRVSGAKYHSYSDLSLIVLDSSGTIISCRFSSARRDSAPLELSLHPGVYRVLVLHFDCKHRDDFTLRMYSSSTNAFIDSQPSLSTGPGLVQRCLSLSASHSLQECTPSQMLWIGQLEEAAVSICLLMGNGIRFIRFANTSTWAVDIVAEIVHEGYLFLSPMSAKVKVGDIVVAGDRQIVRHHLNAFEQKIAAVCIPMESELGEVRRITIQGASISTSSNNTIDASLIPLFNAFSVWD